jgi:glycosyltransferase involved in cell wall biosynthesis
LKNRPLLIDGRSLILSSVGLGVYSARLIKGLLRYAQDLDFRILLPQGTDFGKLGIPADRVVEIPIAPRLGNAYLEGIASDIQLSLFLRRHYPKSLFHATNSFWSPFRSMHVIVTMHDLIPRRFPRYFGRTPLRKFMQTRHERFAASSDLVLAVSHCTARDLTELAGIPPEKISVLHNWVGQEFTSLDKKFSEPRILEMRERLGLPDSYWLYMGGYDYRKNIEFLIQAYARARDEAALPPLVLAGSIPADLSKPYCDVLGALRDAGLSSQEVLMPGRIEEVDLPFLYAGASLVIYPSLYEGFGYPAIEAMAAGTPVLVSDRSSLPELTKNLASLFDPQNLNELKEKMLLAIIDPNHFLAPIQKQFAEREAIREYRNKIEPLMRRPA